MGAWRAEPPLPVIGKDFGEAYGKAAIVGIDGGREQGAVRRKAERGAVSAA